MKVEVVSDNILLVDGKFLQPDQLQKLREIVFTERSLFFDAILKMYEHQKELNPDAEVKYGSVWLMRLAKSIGEVVTPEALERDSNSQENRGVFTMSKDMLPGFKDHWFSVSQAGYLPEIRTASKPKDMKGVCLLATIDEPQKLY